MLSDGMELWELGRLQLSVELLSPLLSPSSPDGIRSGASVDSDDDGVSSSVRTPWRFIRGVRVNSCHATMALLRIDAVGSLRRDMSLFGRATGWVTAIPRGMESAVREDTCGVDASMTANFRGHEMPRGAPG